MLGVRNPSTEAVGTINPVGSTCSREDGALGLGKDRWDFRSIQNHSTNPDHDAVRLSHSNLAPSGKEE